MAHSLDPSQFAVLVVEDDPLLLIDAVDMVEQAGFVAYEARNADQAIRLLERLPDIRLIFNDVEMPGEMDGLKLAEAVRDRWPPMWIIVVSGMAPSARRTCRQEASFSPSHTRTKQ